MAYNKRAIIEKIIAQLGSELEVYGRAAQASRAEATDENNKAENKYDTRGLEASYLARGQSKQVVELEDAKREITVLTPQSPLGEQLAGKMVGQTFSWGRGGVRNPCVILSIA